MIPGISSVNIDSIGTIIAAVLTFFVFSYILGDLPALGPLFKFFYRLAMHVLVGAGVAYALLVAWWSILYPFVFSPLMRPEAGLGEKAIAVAGAALGVLLLFKGLRSLAWLGNIATGYMVGVGLGVAVGGAVIGTLYTQSRAAWMLPGTGSSFDLFLGVLGTLTVLISFTFTATWRKGLAGTLARIVQALSVVGRFFLYIALGATFAGVYVAGVSVLIGQAQRVLIWLGIR